MKNIILTGGAGFIGSHLSEKFSKEGYKVIVVDNLSRGDRENIRILLEEKRAVLYEYDLVEHSNIDKIKNLIIKYKPQYVLHYAAINGTQYFYDIPEKVAEVNSIGTYNLMTALTKACIEDSSIKSIIALASTSETYGEPISIPTEENDITYARISEPRDSYAIAKLMSEFFVKLYAQKIGLQYMIFRIFNVYGPRMVGNRYGQVVPEFIQRIKDGEYPLKIYGDGTHTRSFIYIDDHVDITYEALIRAERNQVYNLGNPTETSIYELGMIIMNAMGLDPKFIFLRERAGDHMRRVPNIGKLLNEIGSFEFISLRDGIKKILNFKQNEI